MPSRSGPRKRLAKQRAEVHLLCQPRPTQDGIPAVLLVALQQEEQLWSVLAVVYAAAQLPGDRL